MPKWQLNRFPCWATLTPRGRETAGGEYNNSQKNAAGCGRSSRPIHSGHRPTNKHTFRWNLIFVGSGHSHGRQSRTQIRLSWLVSLEKENGPEAHMMDKRLLRQFPMAQGHHSNRPTKQEDQQVSYGNGNKETAPAKLEDKANGIDAVHPSIKRYQPKQAWIPRSRSR